jgi:hypothetical protein
LQMRDREKIMKIAQVFICVLIAATVVFSACGNAKGPAAGKGGNSSISEGVMTTAVNDDSKPTAAVATSFSDSTPIIYCSFKVGGVVPEDMIKASWYYVKGAAAGHENELLNETFTIAESDTAAYYLAFYLDKPVSGWYKGDHKVVLSVNSVEKLSVPFSIK